MNAEPITGMVNRAEPQPQDQPGGSCRSSDRYTAMTMAGWIPVQLTVETDQKLGGRWTSLRTPYREWLWTNPAPDIAQERTLVLPGSAFVDAGGVEECIPTIRGVPDHGDAWSRSWSDDQHLVELPTIGTLIRRITDIPCGIRISYQLSGEPGTRFLHAVHALLDIGPAGRIEVPSADQMILIDDEPRLLPWPSGLDMLGPDDGTANCLLLPRCHEAMLIDGDDAISIVWNAPDEDELCSLLIWRNLCGWPPGRPYRSIGIEPMVGRSAELETASPSDCAAINADGLFTWQLQIRALRRHRQEQQVPLHSPGHENNG